MKDILVAVDVDADVDWTATLPAAVRQAQAMDARLHVMTVMPDFGMSIVGQFFPRGYEKDVADRIMKRLHERVAAVVPAGMAVQHIVAEGTVYESILKMAERTRADLIVLGAHRPELSDYLLGPNAARVVRHARCSVLVVRERDDDRSP
ncbi:universal stress protein [Azospirillum halopraeferens]|uniref:universal stress protein n=1 Tax=Azospirillum halopraeferens TaxID=34010 RepID=UPI0003FB6472|nr:universal stress protein [Azospirillum halopraeferens]